MHSESDAVISDGGHGMMFDILLADIPGSSSIDDAPRQVREWSRAQATDSDGFLEWYGRHYRPGEGPPIALSQVKAAYSAHLRDAGDDRSARRVARMTTAECMAAPRFYGHALDGVDSQRPKILAVVHDADGVEDDGVASIYQSELDADAAQSNGEVVPMAIADYRHFKELGGVDSIVSSGTRRAAYLAREQIERAESATVADMAGDGIVCVSCGGCNDVRPGRAHGGPVNLYCVKCRADSPRFTTAVTND